MCCNSLFPMDSNGQFSEIFQWKHFVGANNYESSIFLSSIRYSAQCVCCGSLLEKNTPIFVNYISLSQIGQYGYSSLNWPDYLSDRFSSSIDLICLQCDNGNSISTSHNLFLQAKTLFVELSQDATDQLTLSECIHVLGYTSELTALVRCDNKHFTCATYSENHWNYFDDLCSSVVSFPNLHDLFIHFPKGWFFCIYAVKECQEVSSVASCSVINQDCNYLDIPEEKEGPTEQSKIQIHSARLLTNKGDQEEATKCMYNNSVVIDTEKGKTKVTKKRSQKQKGQCCSESPRKEIDLHRKDYNITIKILESKKKINKPFKRSVLNKDIREITFVKDCLASGMIKRARPNPRRYPDPNRKEQLKQKRKDYLHQYYLKHKLRRKKYNSEYYLKHKVKEQNNTKNDHKDRKIQLRLKAKKYAHEYYLKHKAQNEIKKKNSASSNPKIYMKERKNTKKLNKSQESIESNHRQNTLHDNSLSPPGSVDATYFNNQSVANMKTFHSSMQMVIIQCTVCKEAWPVGKTKAKSVSEETYMCYRCKRDKTLPRKYSLDNNMIPSPAPPELEDLIQFEEMLISRAFPVIHVYTKPRGGQRAYKGHIITLPQDVQQLADILPRVPQDLPVIVFTINGKKTINPEIFKFADKT